MAILGSVWNLLKKNVRIAPQRNATKAEDKTKTVTEKKDTKTVTEKKDFPFDNDATEDFGELDDGDINFDNLHGGLIDAHF